MCKLLQGAGDAGHAGVPFVHHDWQDAGAEHHAARGGPPGAPGLPLELPARPPHHAPPSCPATEQQLVTMPAKTSSRLQAPNGHLHCCMNRPACHVGAKVASCEEVAKLLLIEKLSVNCT